MEPQPLDEREAMTLGMTQQQAEKDRMQHMFDTDKFAYLQLLTNISDNVPANLLKDLWTVFNPVHELTNISRRTAEIQIEQVEIVIARLKMQIPRHKKTIKLINDLDMVLIHFTASVHKSIGGSEREMQATTITRTDMSYKSRDEGTGGILSKLFGGSRR